MKGVPSCNLDGGLETPYLQAPVKKRIDKLLPLARGRYRRRSGRSSCHVTASLTNLLWSSTATRLSRAVADLLDLMGQPDGRELILLSVLSSCHLPLRAGRRAWSSAAG